MKSPDQSTLEARARRAARSVGYLAVKSRRRLDSIDNFGGFMLVDAMTNSVVSGERFSLEAEDVIEYCKPN